MFEWLIAWLETLAQNVDPALFVFIGPFVERNCGAHPIATDYGNDCCTGALFAVALAGNSLDSARSCRQQDPLIAACLLAGV